MYPKAGKKKVKAAAPKSCVKKHTLKRESGCQDITKFFGPKVSSKKTYAAAAQATLPKPAPKPAPLIDLVSSSSSENSIIVDTAKGPVSGNVTTTSTAAKPCDADTPIAAKTSDAVAPIATTSSDAAAPLATTSSDAPVASTARRLISSSSSETCTIVVAVKSKHLSKATYASIAAAPSAPIASTSRGSCDAHAPLDSSLPASNPDEDPSNEPQKNGTASTSSSPTPSPPPSNRRLDAEDAPPQKRRRRNSSSSPLASSPASSSPPPSSSTATSSTPSSSPKRRHENSSSTAIATEPASTSSTVCAATSSTPTPSSSTSPSRSNNLTIDTTLYEKLAEGFKEIEIYGDGACFFRACSHQEYGTEERHQEFRKAANEYFVANHDEMEHQILALHGGTFQQFLDEQIQQKTFADYFDVSAIANVFGVQIIVYRPDSPATVFDPINGVTDPSKNPYLLAFVNNNHYNSIIPIDQECNADGIDYSLNGAATSLKRSDESIAMDYVTPRRTLPARRSKFVKAPDSDKDNDDDSVFEADPMQSDDDYEMKNEDRKQSTDDSVTEKGGSTQSGDDSDLEQDYEITMTVDDDIDESNGAADFYLTDDQTSSSNPKSGTNEELSPSPSLSTGCADKKLPTKLTAAEKFLQQLNEEFTKLHHRVDYFAKNNVQPQLSHGLQYKVLAMYFFYNHQKKGNWWTSFEIAKWIKKKFLYFKNQKNATWQASLRHSLKDSTKLFSHRGSYTKAQYSFIGTFPDVNKKFSQKLAQLAVSPKKSKRNAPPFLEKYAKDFLHYHHHQVYYSENDESPTARTGGLLLYFFFSQQDKRTGWTLLDITNWMKDNILFYKNKTNDNWRASLQHFLKRNKEVFLKTGSQNNAKYTYNGSFPQVEKEDNNQNPQLSQLKSPIQKKCDSTYLRGVKEMKRTPKLAAEKDDDFIFFHQHFDHFSNNSVKPELEYGVFLRYIFYQNPGSWLSLIQIYKWIEENVLFYKTQSQIWRSALRGYINRNTKIFLFRGSGQDREYSYTGTFPKVKPDDIYHPLPFQPKQLFTKFADQQNIINWKYIDKAQEEIQIEGLPYTYHAQKTGGRVPDNISYFYCVHCSCKEANLAHGLGQFQHNLKSKTSRLQLNNGVLRGNPQAIHLCEDEAYGDVSGRVKYGIFTAADREKYIESSEKLAEYMAGLMEETLLLSIFQFVPKSWLHYDPSTKCKYLYGLSFSDDPRSFWYVGITGNPWKRFIKHSGSCRKHMFYNKDGSKREVLMTILLCMPSHDALARELEAAVIRFGKNHHNVLNLKKRLTNIDNGEWQSRDKPEKRLETITRSLRHADFGKVGRALRALLDDGAARGPRLSSLAIGISDEEKEDKKESRRLKSS